MPPRPAEVARTLATGRRPGRLSMACAPGIAVIHATTADGTVLVAAHPGQGITPNSAAALTVADRPPFPDSPFLGRVHIGGWLDRVSATDARAAAIEFAEANPAPVLLDLGAGIELFRLRIDEVRLDAPQGTAAIEPSDFAAADPDPFHADEQDLLQDLRDHYLAEIAALVPEAWKHGQPSRLDRYGLVLTQPDRTARLEFPQPANGPCCVARALGLGHQTC